MFELKGDDSLVAEKKATGILGLETKLAKTSFTRLERRSPEKNYNKMTLAQLQKISHNINWKAYFTNIGLNNPGDINVGQPRFFSGISKIMQETPVNVWKAYLEWNLLDDAAPYLSKDFVRENFNFYGKTMSGQQKMQPRWKRVMRATSHGLGQALGELYVAKYFPPESKKRMVQLVNNLDLAFEIVRRQV